MATQTQTATEPQSDAVVDQKIQKLRELYADAPELGRAALERGLAVGVVSMLVGIGLLGGAVNQWRLVNFGNLD